MPAPTPKQRRAAKQRDALGWRRNARKAKYVRPYIGAHVHWVGGDKLGTVREIFMDEDYEERARVQHFNGEWWDWHPRVAVLQVLD